MPNKIVKFITHPLYFIIFLYKPKVFKTVWTKWDGHENK